MKGMKYVAIALVVLAAAVGAGRADAGRTVGAGEMNQICQSLFEDGSYALPARVGHKHSYEVYYGKMVARMNVLRPQAADALATEVLDNCLDAYGVFYRTLKHPGALTLGSTIAAYGQQGAKDVRPMGRAFVHDIAVVSGTPRQAPVYQQESVMIGQVMQGVKRNRAKLTTLSSYFEVARLLLH